ncbi:simple sugar transport system permease protein/ribose transport system permease protein [Salinibacillus kushneri]|uniref:Simple sugar transport system permease protein/ribose transport system permease protein n=1 Tax=Salinibacillus kushneri TaxID=237682 RepID=A0A1H9Z1L1_9BACI|nr:ABC transporter permease [Salinibacillus kushneri]SES74749.1 simple sugar transport system permease protein/ribose transport system permease protein [Salinibacillus kushneri]
MKSLFKQKEFSIIAIIIVLSIILSFVSPVFLTIGNFIDIIEANTVMGILAIGMTLIIITSDIDVSVAAVTTAVAVIIGSLFGYLPDSWLSLVIIFIAAPIIGLVIGSVNGFLVSKINIPAIVVTLGILNIINGLVLYFTNGRYLNSTNFPESFLAFSDFELFGIPILIYILAIVAILTWYILKHTFIGRSVLAIGGNQQSAVRVGIDYKKVKLFVFAYMGFLCGVAAVAQTAYTTAVDPNGLLGLELMVIAAVVLGGTNIHGGRGTVHGTLLGVLLLAIMENGMILARIDTFWQKVVTGAIIVFAVSYDHISYKRKQAKLAKIEVEV